MSATVRRITNGFMVGTDSIGGAFTNPVSYFAGSIPEAVYWLAHFYEPQPSVMAARAAKIAKQPSQQAIVDNDPLLGQIATVSPVTSGGYLVQQGANAMAGAQFIEQWCANMDAVHGALNLIFAPPQ